MVCAMSVSRAPKERIRAQLGLEEDTYLGIGIRIVRASAFCGVIPGSFASYSAFSTCLRVYCMHANTRM